jgi:hypothetical protein
VKKSKFAKLTIWKTSKDKALLKRETSFPTISTISYPLFREKISPWPSWRKPSINLKEVLTHTQPRDSMPIRSSLRAN